MIVLGLVVLPGELSKLATVFQERKTNGTRYSGKRPHVVVCSGSLRSDTARDLLMEFFAVQTTAKPFVVFLGSAPQTKELYTLLQQPRWRTNAQFLHGSPLVKVRFTLGSLARSFVLAHRGTHWAALCLRLASQVPAALETDIVPLCKYPLVNGSSGCKTNSAFARTQLHTYIHTYIHYLPTPTEV